MFSQAPAAAPPPPPADTPALTQLVKRYAGFEAVACSWPEPSDDSDDPYSDMYGDPYGPYGDTSDY